MMMWLKLSGGYVNLRFVEINRIIIKKMRWLKLVCWHFCYLASKKTGKWLPSVCQFIITRLGGYPKLFLAVWVITITDWLYKKQTFGTKTKKKNHNSKVWFALYMQPKVFWSHTCPKPSNISSGVFCRKGSRRKNVIFTLTLWVLYKCYDLKPFWFPATFWEMSLH